MSFFERVRHPYLQREYAAAMQVWIGTFFGAEPSNGIHKAVKKADRACTIALFRARRIRG